MDQEKARKMREAAAAAAADYGTVSGAWISKGLVVKVMAQQLREYYKKKGIILSLPEQYVAKVEMLDSGDILHIDQAELETVRSLSLKQYCTAKPVCTKQPHRNWQQVNMLPSGQMLPPTSSDV